MISDAVNENFDHWIEAEKLTFRYHEEFYSRWIEHPSSCIIHHESECCEEARLWFLAYARSMEGSAATQNKIKPPVWLSQLFKWGPSVWPITWCQVIKEKTIDCGVFAALAREVFSAQGFSAHPAQALLSYNNECTGHWKDLWKTGMNKFEKRKVGEVFPWVGTEIVYHEICLLELSDGETKIYDSTFGNWLEFDKRKGFGALLSVRSECPRLLKWGDKILISGEWADL